MKLLVLTNLYPNTTNAGGAFVEERLRAYASMGVQVEGVALTLDYGHLGSAVGSRRAPPKLQEPSLLRPADIPFSPAHRVAIQKHGLPRAWVLRHLARSLLPLRNGKPDLVIGHGMYQASAGWLAKEVARSVGAPYSVTLHGGDVNYEMYARRAEFADTLRAARGSLFVSAALRRRAEDFLGTLSPTQVVGNGYDPTLFFPPAGRGGTDGPKAVLYVGRLAEVKGADRLPAIFRAVATLAPSTRFRIVGDGPLEQLVRDATTDLPVEFLGRLGAKEVGEAMRAAQLLVMPSRSEGWPTVIHEAQACGLSVVASDVGGVKEALHSPADLVAEGAAFPERFARKAVQRLTGPWARATLTASADPFTWKRVAEAELDFYGRILAT